MPDAPYRIEAGGHVVIAPTAPEAYRLYRACVLGDVTAAGQLMMEANGEHLQLLRDVRELLARIRVEKEEEGE